MAFAAVFLGVVAVSDPTSAMHGRALVLAVAFLSLTPVINCLRELRLATIAFLAAIFAVTLMLALGALSHGDTFGLGHAERAWFAIIYLCNAWILDVVPSKF